MCFIAFKKKRQPDPHTWCMTLKPGSFQGSLHVWPTRYKEVTNHKSRDGSKNDQTSFFPSTGCPLWPVLLGPRPPALGWAFAPDEAPERALALGLERLLKLLVLVTLRFRPCSFVIFLNYWPEYLRAGMTVMGLHHISSQNWSSQAITTEKSSHGFVSARCLPAVSRREQFRCPTVKNVWNNQCHVFKLFQPARFFLDSWRCQKPRRSNSWDCRSRMRGLDQLWIKPLGEQHHINFLK